MMRKFTHYFLVCTIWLSVVSCDQDEEVSQPPKPSFTVDQTSGLVGDTEFTFTVQQVSAGTVTLFPYGIEDPGTVISGFENGQAVVTLKYSRPGQFQVVVRANNHDDEGLSVKNSESDPVTVSIASDDKAIIDFSFFTGTETEINDATGTIDVTVSYPTKLDTLKAIFTSSPFSTVSVGGAEQTSGENTQDFTNPVQYVVTANNGETRTYTVNVTVTPPDIRNAFKSITAKAVSKSAEEKELGVAIDTVNLLIVVYDTLGTPEEQFDSVRISYETSSELALVKYNGKAFKQDSLLNLVSAHRQLEVFPQDSAEVGTQGPALYDVYYADAPRIDSITFTGLVPQVVGKPDGFTINVNVLDGTDIAAIATDIEVTEPAGVTITGYKVDGINYTPGNPIDFSEPVALEIIVTDANIPGVTYSVTYTINVTVLP